MGVLICSNPAGLGFRFTMAVKGCRTWRVPIDVCPQKAMKTRTRCFCMGPQRALRFYCCSDSSSKPPQDTVLEALSEVAKSDGRVAQTTNIVLGGTVSGTSDEEWKILNEKVNSYPTTMNFTAIGSGGDDFVQAMVGAVESVLQYPIPEDEVRMSMSSKGKYVSVKIGPVAVDSSDQVQAVYRAMKRDERMKYYL
ncbi:hypothetical protein KP509_09G033500 [Ceratopteris richardii]|uniref:Uncharacterized protein n=1 Tax=Ceratopteris richardii TaxID=49495 RepID=A0A8T2U6E2_CERRI|nr:hypothetical protein KP509_09G033500 [Ceratopteris richardii]